MTDFRPSSLLLSSSLLLLSACGGGGGGGGSSHSSANSPPVITSCTNPSTGNTTILGTVTYDLVPHKINQPGLNYAAIQKSPAPWVTVVALDADTNLEITRTTTKSNGGYQLLVPNNTNIQLQVLAEMVRTASPILDMRVVDGNTNNAQWLIADIASCTGTDTETRDLNAGSGWVANGSGGSYANERAAAPFAILDDIYKGVQLILPALQASTTNPSFPKLTINWSPANTQSTIFSTHFSNDPANYQIAVLGDENVNTDEYDNHVIAHEFGHYIEAAFSRSDSIGGRHYLGEPLDMRVAFGEGYGTAFSGMVMNNSNYFDTSGIRQSADRINYDIASPGYYDPNPGWFSETSIAAILYRSYASNYLNLTFQPIFTVLAGPQKNTTSLTSIFSFMSALKTTVPNQSTGIANLLSNYNITGASIDAYGSTETNNGGLMNSVLPVYTNISVDRTASPVCTEITENLVTAVSKTDTLNYAVNKLGNFRFIRLNTNTTGIRTITLTGDSNSAPQFRVYANGSDLYNVIAYQPKSNSMTGTGRLVAGEYIIMVYDFNLLSPLSTRTNPSCLSLMVN